MMPFQPERLFIFNIHEVWDGNRRYLSSPTPHFLPSQSPIWGKIEHFGGFVGQKIPVYMVLDCCYTISKLISMRVFGPYLRMSPGGRYSFYNGCSGWCVGYYTSPPWVLVTRFGYFFRIFAISSLSWEGFSKAPVYIYLWTFVGNKSNVLKFKNVNSLTKIQIISLILCIHLF